MTRSLLLLALLLPATHAAAQDRDRHTEPVELVCLDRLEVGPLSGVARDVASDAQVHTDTITNCFVVIGPRPQATRLREVMTALETRATSRSSRVAPSARQNPSSRRKATRSR